MLRNGSQLEDGVTRGTDGTKRAEYGQTYGAHESDVNDIPVTETGGRMGHLLALGQHESLAGVGVG